MQTKLHHIGGLAGPIIVFLHGYGADRFSWLAVAPMLQDIARIYAIDLPGHGDAPDVAGEVTLKALADAVSEAAGSLNAPVYLVGHSLGCAVALTMVNQQPARFCLLSLISPAGFGSRIDSAFLTAFTELREAETAQNLLEQMVTKPRHITPAIVAHVLTSLDKTPDRRAGLEKIAAMLTGLAPFEDLESLKNCLTIWGQDDRIIAPQVSILGTLLTGVGHVPQIEAASAVHRALRAQIMADLISSSQRA